MQVEVLLSAAIMSLCCWADSAAGDTELLAYEYMPELHDIYSEKTFVYRSSANSAVYKTRVHNATLRKCRCLGDQVWDGWRCVDTQTLVAVYDPTTGHAFAVQTAEFGRVKTGEPQCPEGQALAVLDSNRHSEHQFSLMDSGVLYWQQRQYEWYCIDHTMDENGEPTSWEAHVCLPPPNVPRCCPKGLLLGTNDSCVTHASQVISPPIMVDGVLVEWPTGTSGDIDEITCEGFEDMVKLPLNNNGSYLNYLSGNASFVWLPPNSIYTKQEKDYCLGVEEGREGYVVTVCYEDLIASHKKQCSNNTCVRKCCPENQLIIGSSCGLAVNESEIWKPSFMYSDLNENGPSPVDLKLVYGFPLCKNKFIVGSADSGNEELTLLVDGYLHVSGFQNPYPPDQYCIDKFRIADTSAPTQALICFSSSSEATTCTTVAKSYLYPSLLLVSCVFLTLTLAAYASVPELRNKLHGRCLLSLVSSLLLAYILLAIIFLTKTKIPGGLCTTIASVLLWSFLAAFFWLNVMCFDIWRTLKVMRTSSASEEWIRRRYRLYCLYSWGCPLAITLVAVVMETLPGEHNVIRPNFSDTCWFTDRKSFWVYLYGYVLALVLANTTFFLLVAYILLKSHNDPILKRTREQNRERLWLYAKLFLVMGVTWLADVISYQEGTCAAWILTDIINALQGFTIFLVFVCKRGTLFKLREQCCARCLAGGVEAASTSSTRTTAVPHSPCSLSPRSSNTDRTKGNGVDNKAHSPKNIPLATLVETNGNPPEQQSQLEQQSHPEQQSHRLASPSPSASVPDCQGCPGEYTSEDEDSVMIPHHSLLREQCCARCLAGGVEAASTSSTRTTAVPHSPCSLSPRSSNTDRTKGNGVDNKAHSPKNIPLATLVETNGNPPEQQSQLEQQSHPEQQSHRLASPSPSASVPDCQGCPGEYTSEDEDSVMIPHHSLVSSDGQVGVVIGDEARTNPRDVPLTPTDPEPLTPTEPEPLTLTEPTPLAPTEPVPLLQKNSVL